jgi:oligopeptide/dipeptide ABC transporter ATP-binding protein
VSENGTLLKVEDLRMYFPIRKGFLQRIAGYVKAVDGVTLSIREGETLGLVGESGCGKTTTGRCIMGGYTPTGGDIQFRVRDGEWLSIPEQDRQGLRRVRREVQMVFQDPYSSLNPRMTLKQIVGEPLIIHGMAEGKQLEERVAELLSVVGLRPEYMIRYPHAFSGGQRQRIGLARALALNPRLVVADEPVSALDVSIQAQILNLMQDLQAQFGLTYLFVAHDLSVIKHISDRVAVMYVGKLVELAETRELFRSPKCPYTEALMSAVPKPDPLKRTERIVLTGDVPSPANPPPGCTFHPRCGYAQEVCGREEPPLEEVLPDHFVRCHFARELDLKGVST